MVRHMNSNSKCRRGAFTLVELLVVIAIIGILVALLLPAIQAARESARRTQCKNQLKQLALSFQMHHDTHKFFPSGGWGPLWLGFPEQGYGASQSGSWLYSLLPYMEEQALHGLGKGTTGTARRDACKQRVESPFEGMMCPSRRRTNVYPLKESAPKTYRYCTAPLERSSRTDYAANGGSIRTTETDDGPHENGENMLAIVPDDHQFTASINNFATPKSDWNGIVFYRSEVNMRNVTDGTSKTYLVGEKWMFFENYETGQDTGDGEPAFSGNNDDTIRVTYREWPFGPDTQYTAEVPANPSSNPRERRAFGSPHNGGFNMALCDGSVDFVGFDIEPDVHAYRGARNDGDVPTKEDPYGGGFD
jgi:prepilin-type N-terminal cleavage/methylation domain-containing protein/prepilin-type processing-associated H-X9-DG protein